MQRRWFSVGAAVLAAAAVAYGIRMRGARIASTVETAPVEDASGPPPDLPEVPRLDGYAPPDRSADLPPHLRDPEVAREVAVLAEARERLASDPEGALRLADRHRRQYPRGALSESREVLAIEALLALSRVEEAERRLYAFRERYPESRDLERLQTATTER